jgi:DNA replication and repair protein RecF
MFLSNLYLKDLRIFDECNFSFSHRCNIFYGPNGVGKTSILEGIGYIGRGRSFRTPCSKKLIRHDQHSCTITGILKKSNLLHRVGIEIQPTNNRRIQLNGQTLKGHAPLVELMPTLWINPFNTHLFLATPALRRQFINWGVFHFTKDFYDAWDACHKILQQRNMALKRRLNDEQVRCWDDAFVKYANTLDQMRSAYIAALKPFVIACIDQFMAPSTIDLRYDRGWRADVNLEELLKRNLANDQRVKHTQWGPHRMDIKLCIENKNVQDFCSQGQHKLLSYVFYLAQAQLFEKKHAYSPIFLIDDLPSELDAQRRGAVATMLNKLGSQVFISGVEKESFTQFCHLCDSQLFHVKQGNNL